MSAALELHKLRLLQCYQLARLAASIPTGEMLESIERADAFGPMLDPTLWQKNQAAMMEDKRVVEVVHGLAELGRALAAQARNRGGPVTAHVLGLTRSATERLEREGQADG